MGLRFYNTLTKRVENFKPIEGKKVKIYSCGPTTYDYSHIGNFRYYIFVDLLKRYLKFLDYEVDHVMNITDVDDKIIARCKEENKAMSDLASKYKNIFFQDIETLRILPADSYPNATAHISEMQSLIQKLLDNGNAYVTSDGSVFFNISSFRDYGQLSKVNLSDIIQSERVLSDEYNKESIRDFALWKGWKEEDGDVYWDSPWGKGRPGWHIECSAMSIKYLGEHFDIHCGGVDLIFPHHENEIAQSICAMGKPFVNTWLHCEHLLVDGAKMSKSLGNFYTLQDLLDKGFSPLAIRYFLLSAHYRQKLNLTFESLKAATKAIERLQDFRRRLELKAKTANPIEIDYFNGIEERFMKVMNEDLNISGGMAVIFDWIRDTNRLMDENQLSNEETKGALNLLKKFNSIIGVIFEAELLLSGEEKRLIQEREEARRNKNWKKADEIREYFLKRKIRLEDTTHGTVAKKMINQV